MNLSEFWQDAIVPTLVEYIRIPAKSPHFDRDWQSHGYIDEAARLAAQWCERNAIAGMKLEIVRLEGRTPCLFIDVPGTASSKDTVLLYGHLDKQPEMTGWREGLGPWTPVIQEGKLYGRGGADDGYAVFCAIAARPGERRPHRRGADRGRAFRRRERRCGVELPHRARPARSPGLCPDRCRGRAGAPCRDPGGAENPGAARRSG